MGTAPDRWKRDIQRAFNNAVMSIFMPNFGRFSSPKLKSEIQIFAKKTRSKIDFASKYDSEALRNGFWTSKRVVLRSIFDRMLMLKRDTPKPAKMTPTIIEKNSIHHLRDQHTIYQNRGLLARFLNKKPQSESGGKYVFVYWAELY